jgi:hypothetical protein
MRIDQQVVNRTTMPQSLCLLYEQIEPAPALHLLNPLVIDATYMRHELYH